MDCLAFVTDSFIWATASGFVRSEARLLIFCSAMVSLVIDVSMIRCTALAVLSRAGACLSRS